MAVFAARAFDKFADANAAADELRGSGFVNGEVLVTANPANPDGTPGTSLADEVARLPGILGAFIRCLFDLDQQYYVRRRSEEIRCGGVVVFVPVRDADERAIVRAVFYRYRAVELGNVPGGVPIY